MMQAGSGAAAAAGSSLRMCVRFLDDPEEVEAVPSVTHRRIQQQSISSGGGSSSGGSSSGGSSSTSASARASSGNSIPFAFHTSSAMALPTDPCVE